MNPEFEGKFDVQNFYFGSGFCYNLKFTTFISLQPEEFKPFIFQISKIFMVIRHLVPKNIGIRKSELVAKIQISCQIIVIHPKLNLETLKFRFLCLSLYFLCCVDTPCILNILKYLHCTLLYIMCLHSTLS